MCPLPPTRLPCAPHRPLCRPLPARRLRGGLRHVCDTSELSPSSPGMWEVIQAQAAQTRRPGRDQRPDLQLQAAAIDQLGTSAFLTTPCSSGAGSPRDVDGTQRLHSRRYRRGGVQWRQLGNGLVRRVLAVVVRVQRTDRRVVRVPEIARTPGQACDGGSAVGEGSARGARGSARVQGARSMASGRGEMGCHRYHGRVTGDRAREAVGTSGSCGTRRRACAR